MGTLGEQRMSTKREFFMYEELLVFSLMSDEPNSLPTPTNSGYWE